jgi:acyl phosphate:glycerol-3-phosphate acyltransferase
MQSYTHMLPVAGYLLGSISSAVVVSKLMRLPDPRTHGSNNPGATNVLRLGGKTAAGLTLLGDSLKGFIPMIVGYFMHASPALLAGTGIAAFLGHLYPLFFRFKGGKGVATALGIQFGIWWPIGLTVAAIWALVAKLGKISSIAGLVSMALAPAVVWFFTVWWSGENGVFWRAQLFITVLLFWRHRSNIRDLIQGTEGRIVSKSDDSD